MNGGTIVSGVGRKDKSENKLSRIKKLKEIIIPYDNQILLERPEGRFKTLEKERDNKNTEIHEFCKLVIDKVTTEGLSKKRTNEESYLESTKRVGNKCQLMKAALQPACETAGQLELTEIKDQINGVIISVDAFNEKSVEKLLKFKQTAEKRIEEVEKEKRLVAIKAEHKEIAANNGKYEKQMIPILAENLTVSKYYKKLLCAARCNFGKVMVGIVCSSVGVASIINEVGAAIGHTAFYVQNIITLGLGSVCLYFGVKLFNKSGPSHTYYKLRNEERKIEIDIH